MNGPFSNQLYIFYREDPSPFYGKGRNLRPYPKLDLQYPITPRSHLPFATVIHHVNNLVIFGWFVIIPALCKITRAMLYYV
jgi:hypothetical protein